jgi:hypothetical protein
VYKTFIGKDRSHDILSLMMHLRNAGKNRYLFIGGEISTFTAPEPITDFISNGDWKAYTKHHVVETLNYGIPHYANNHAVRNYTIIRKRNPNWLSV